MLWMTLFSRNPSSHRYKLILFWSFKELLTGHPEGGKDMVQYLNNILFFIPFGVLLPWKKSWKQVLFASFTVSVLIELLQFVFAVGLTESDDVISNVLGGVIGF